MMLPDPSSEKDAFLNFLHHYYEQVANSDELSKVRAKAWDHFLEIGLPTRETEVFRYIKLKNLYAHSLALSFSESLDLSRIRPFVLPDCEQSYLVFVNGHFRPDLSSTAALPSRVVISTLSDAMKTFGAFLNNNWARSMKEELDPFAVLNAALHRDGAFIYLPPKQKIEAPIQILHLIDAHDEPMWILPRIHVFAGAFSEAKLYSTQDVLSGEKYCLNQVMELNLEEGALLQLGSSAYKQNSGIWKFEAIRALLKRSSSFKSVDINQGGETSRYDYKVLLTQENAEVSLSGAALLNESDESHTNVLIDHQAPYCRSMQLFKGICTDFSRSTFEGKILVRKQAQKTEAFQLNNHLLLSDRAIAYSKPNLEIYADDVKASHGATVGQLDREQLFYLKARGFSDYEAKELLIKGFYKEVIDLLEFPYLKQRILEKVKGFSLPKKVSTAV